MNKKEQFIAYKKSSVTQGKRLYGAAKRGVLREKNHISINC